MAWPLIRIDLDEQSPDFRKLALQPGFPVLDRQAANSHVLRRWLGRFAADAAWDGQTVKYLWRDDDDDDSSPPSSVSAASLADFRGVLKSEVAALQAKLQQAAPKTANERLLFNVMQQQLRQTLDGDVDPPGMFYKVRVRGRWKSVWCWGYDRRHTDPRPLAICQNEDCRLARFPAAASRGTCPRCGAKVRTGRVRRAMLLLALLLMSIGGAGYFLRDRLEPFLRAAGTSVTGNVVDAVTGRPIPHAVVQATADPQQRTETDTEGTFQLTSPTGSIERLEISAAGYQSENWDAPRSRAAGDRLQIKLRGAAEITGLVVEAGSDRPIPFPTIQVAAFGHQVNGDDGGMFLLPGIPSGAAEFQIAAEGYQTLQVKRDLEPGRSAELLFSLVGAATIRGTVQDILNKQPIPNAMIKIAELPDETQTDREGKFQRSEVPGVNCRFEVAAPGYLTREFERAVEPTGETALRFLLRPELSGFNVAVVDTSGAAVPAAKVRLIDDGKPLTSLGDGLFQALQLRPGTYRIEASADGFTSNTVEVTAPKSDDGPIQIVLNGGTRLLGRVVDAVRQSPVAAAEVWLDDRKWKTVTDDAGRFEFTELPAGRLSLEVIGRGFRAAESEAELAIGENTIEVVLRGGTVISGKVVSKFDRLPLTGAVVELEGVAATQVTDVDGRFRFEDFTGDLARIHVTAAGFVPHHVDQVSLADQETEITVELRGEATLAGRVVAGKSEQPLANANIQVGSDLTLTTNELGEFQLQDCPARIMHLRASAAGFLPEELDHDLAQKSDTPLEIRLKPLTTVHGLVVDARTDLPVPGAKITNSDSLQTATSDAEGRFTFQAPAAASYEFVVNAAGYSTQTFVEQVMPQDSAQVAKNGDDSAPVRLALQRDTEELAEIPQGNQEPETPPVGKESSDEEQFGTTPRPEKDPTTVEFCGVRKKAAKVGFVVDCSGSMAGTRLERTKLELLKSVLNLHPKQMYYVSFFDDRAYPMFEQKPAPIVASPVNKVRTYKWMKTVNGGGGTNPLPAMDDVVRMSTPAIFLLSDGVFEPLPESMYQQIAQQKSHVNTIAFEDESGKQSLQEIANRTGGSYRFMPPAPIPELYELGLLTQLYQELLDVWLDPQASSVEAQDSHEALIEFCNGEDFGPGVNPSESDRRRSRLQWQKWWVDHKLTPEIVPQPDKRIQFNLNHRNFWLRWASIDALSQKQEQNGGLFLPKLKDSEPGVHQAARRALMQLAGDEDYGPALDADSAGRAAAFDQWTDWWRRQRYIANLKNKPDDSLVHDFDNGDLKTRRAAVQSAADRNTFRRPDQLIKRLTDPDAKVRQSAHQALVRASGKDHGPGDCSDLKRCEAAEKDWQKWYVDKYEKEAEKKMRIAERFAGLQQADSAKKKKWYQKVVEEFPGTDAAAKAQARLGSLPP